jgi:hypothetical protein
MHPLKIERILLATTKNLLRWTRPMTWEKVRCLVLATLPLLLLLLNLTSLLRTDTQRSQSDKEALTLVQRKTRKLEEKEDHPP